MYGFADKLRSKGRFGDSLVAHLSEAEARFLKKQGGSGTTNPFTGAVEFYKGSIEGEQANNPKSSFFQSLANIDANEREEGTRLDGFYNNIQALYDKNRADTSPKNGGTNKFQENQALAVAKILNNTRYVYNDKEGIHQYMYFSDDGGNPFDQKTNQELDKRLHEVSPRIRKLVVGGQGTGATNEDLAARDMSIFLRAISPDGLDSFKRGRPLVSQENLFKAYETLGIKPYNFESGNRHTKGFQGDGWTEYQTIDGIPISLAQQEVTDATRNVFAKNKNNFNKSSADADGTGGTGTQKNMGAGSFGTFSEAVDAMFAPSEENIGSFNNLADAVKQIHYTNALKFLYDGIKEQFSDDKAPAPIAGLDENGFISAGANPFGNNDQGFGPGQNYGFGSGNPFAEGGD